jgi:hypothetical protein
MNTSLATNQTEHVGRRGLPRISPRGGGWGGGPYYVRTAHAPIPPTSDQVISPRETAHVAFDPDSAPDAEPQPVIGFWLTMQQTIIQHFGGS